MEDELTQIENQLISSRDLSRDYALKLLSDAVYRNRETMREDITCYR